MNTQAFSHAFGALGSTQKWDGGVGLGLSFQDFPASQDNYLEFAEFSQVLMGLHVPAGIAAWDLSWYRLLAAGANLSGFGWACLVGCS